MKKNYIKKGIPVAVAMSLLTTQLGACEKISTENESVKNEFLELQDLSMLVGIPKPFAEIDFDEVFNGSGTDYYNQLKNNEIQGSTKDLIDFYTSIVGNNGVRRNVSITFSPVNSENEWIHSLILTADDVMLYSENKDTQLGYITGLCDGELYNDLGIISDGRCKDIESNIKESGYDTKLDEAKTAIVGLLGKLEMDGLIGLSAGESEVYSYDGDLTAYAQTLMPVENDFKNVEDSLASIQ